MLKYSENVNGAEKQFRHQSFQVHIADPANFSKLPNIENRMNPNKLKHKRKKKKLNDLLKVK